MRDEVSYHPDEVTEAFGRVAAAIVAGQPRDEVLSVIALSVRTLVRADLAAVTVELPSGDLMTVAAEGVDADRYRHVVYPPEGTSTERVLRSGVSLVVEDLSRVPVIGARLPGVALGPTAFVPIAINGPFGSLSVSRLVGRPVFSERDLNVIRCFAAHSALVIENADGRRRRLALDRVAEQARIAGDLQATAVKEIAAVTATIARLADETAGDQRALALRAVGTLDGALTLIRDAAVGLKESADADTNRDERP